MKQKKVNFESIENDYWLFREQQMPHISWEEYKTKYWTTTWKTKFTEIGGNIKI